jgi:excisionase family DNA binding protein
MDEPTPSRANLEEVKNVSKRTNDEGEELLTVADAAKLLGVGRTKMSELIASGELPVVGKDPLDKRVRLIKRSDVDTLLKRSAKKDAA